MSEGIGPIERFMTTDHVEIDRLLASCEGEDGTVDEAIYARFRERLLRHIAMEEKVLLPDARARRSGVPLPMAFQLRRDHGEIAKLLVRPPSRERLVTLRQTLARHNVLEEGPHGLYALCDELAADQAGAVIERLVVQPRVPLAPYYDGPLHDRVLR